MNNITEISIGNLLDLYTDANKTEFINNDVEYKESLNSLDIKVYRGPQKVVSIEENKINELPINNYEPIVLNEEWLKRFNAIPQGQSGVEIGKLRFKRTQIGLIYCNDNFEPIAGERLIGNVHQLQNLYLNKTGEELCYSL